MKTISPLPHPFHPRHQRFIFRFRVILPRIARIRRIFSEPQICLSFFYPSYPFHPRLKFPFCVFLCLFVALISCLPAQEIKTLKLSPAANMSRAELHYVATVANPKAVLVLCPGCNGSGENLVRSPEWIAFAREHRLGLVGLSFASPMPAIHDGTGYYYASHGSGEKLLEGIRKIYGRDLPVLLYGFSGGAHFTSRFEEWRPDKVITWCAYSAGWWDEPKANPTAPPGIIACGDEDPRYGASLIYFKQGRAAGKPWLWVGLPHTGHAGSRKLDQFVRNYFASVLKSQFGTAAYLDIDREVKVCHADQAAQPSLTGWMPSDDLLDEWRQINEP